MNYAQQAEDEMWDAIAAHDRPMRYAMVRNARTQQELEAYLPDGYRVLGKDWYENDGPGALPRYVIGGRDSAGWTLDGYVIPRLASGLIFAEEIDLSHPIMKVIPA